MIAAKYSTERASTVPAAPSATNPMMALSRRGFSVFVWRNIRVNIELHTTTMLTQKGTTRLPHQGRPGQRYWYDTPFSDMM